MVKRYWKETGQIPSAVGEHPEGDYVKFADYAALAAKRTRQDDTRIKSSHVRLVPWCDCCQCRVPIDHVCECEVMPNE